jgi:hypothetical protein
MVNLPAPTVQRVRAALLAHVGIPAERCHQQKLFTKFKFCGKHLWCWTFYMGTRSHIFNRKHFIVMLKKSLLLAAFIVLFASALFLIYGIVEKVAAKKLVQFKTQTLPQARLFALDSSRFSFPPSALAIIFFNSGCEHCQYEMKEINKKQSLFLNDELVLLSSENISAIKKASEDFGFANMPNIHFAKINDEDVFSAFGSVSVPHIFIYDKDHRLIKEFKGETKVEAIAKYLP